MSFQVEIATEADADRIASIHLAAFDSNIMLHAQFPTNRALSGLHEVLVEDIIRSIRDPSKEVCVIREMGLIVSFAKWFLPDADEGLVDEIHWPKDTDIQLLNEYFDKCEEEKNLILGSRSCYSKKSFDIFHSKLLLLTSHSGAALRGCYLFLRSCPLKTINLCS